MNEVINKDYRKKNNLKWLNDNYFISIYDSKDNYINTFEDIEKLAKNFNIPLKEILRKIKNKLTIESNEKIYKIYLYKKEKINENYRRSR